MSKLDDVWNKIARDMLVGKTIKSVRYMDKEEADEMSWGDRSLIITLSDGTELIPSADDEGNNAGVLYTNSQKHPILPVLR